MSPVELVEGGPWRPTVRHTGAVVRGSGVFTVEAEYAARA